MEKSLVEWYGYNTGSCGYCKVSSNCSHGMLAIKLTCFDYQNLIDRGWRRSGTYCYKPEMNKTCCPLYTIKCEASNFSISKSQKKVIKQVNKYLNFGIKPTKYESETNSLQQQNLSKQIINVNSYEHGSSIEQNSYSNIDKNQIDSDICDAKSNQSKEIGPNNILPIKSLCTLNNSELKNSSIKEAIKVKIQPKKGLGCDPNRPKMIKAKLMRLNRLQNKSQTDYFKIEKEKFLDTSENSNPPKSLEQHLFDVCPNPKHKLEVQLIKSNTPNEIFLKNFKDSYNVYKKYQIHIHGDNPNDISERKYTRFLVNSPLLYKENLGSYHQLYFLDGQLIAVGVLDILPNCVSSVYFFYDPDFEYLSLGTYSALREIALTRSLNISNYYMGFYVHSCPKMRYKGQFNPSYLLCPEAYTWHPISECIQKLDANKYSRFSPTDSVDADDNINLMDICVFFEECETTYRKAIAKKRPRRKYDRQDISDYSRLIGSRLASMMFLKLD